MKTALMKALPEKSSVICSLRQQLYQQIVKKVA